MEGIFADGFEGGACQDAEGVFSFASVGEDLHDGVLAVQAQDPGDGGLGEDAFHDGVAGECAGDGFVPDGVLCGAGCGGEQQVQDVGGEHGCVLEEDHLAAGGGPVSVEGVDDGGVHQGGGHGGLLSEVWCVVVSFLLVGKSGSGFLPGFGVGGIWGWVWGWWVFWLVGGVFKFFLFFWGVGEVCGGLLGAFIGVTVSFCTC